MFITSDGYNVIGIINVFQMARLVYQTSGQTLEHFMMYIHQWTEDEYEEFYHVYMTLQN